MHSLHSSGSGYTLQLPDSGSEPNVLVDGRLQDFAASLLRTVPPNGDFIYLQRVAADTIRQNNNGDFIYLQRVAADTIRQNNNGDFIYLQRFAACRDEPRDIIIWLMRARDTTNTRYIYWRSPRVPGVTGVDTSLILIDTMEATGNIYEPP